ncbi:pre-mRNA splicing protein PRP31 [Methanobrevibacter smithii CAG:186]|uniref:Pre-mRNA splicing protein PRP31 n=1 Tax=Methanobrevibacter smithii CAG:186 TaxID=1263088 RepID=R7PYD6_METSM|nr:pre-mRNA splicing protein PRP31 [Methanobrevibacter smithii]CDF29537.1 pre-mRNA splicing protein PRP31 [Methanobrevibacter smithii CAG:186]
MECYITYCIKGFLAFSEDFELITQKLFPKESIVTALMEIENKKIVSQEKEIIEEVSKDYDKIIIESNKRISDYSCLKSFDKLEIKTPNAGGEYLRSNLEKFVGDDYLEVYQQLAIAKMKEASKSEDKHLIQAINSIDEIDESISKLIERIREWYALYFPEMDVIKNNETYVRLIAENKTKEKIIEAKPDVFLIDSDYDEEINQSDLDIMNNYANSIYELQKSRKSIENYIEDKMESLAPNLKLLVGASLGAKLISHAGGLKRLATYPSSTVQIMGAEKALFRHLKSGDRPPKYGLIYQHPQIRGAKWWNRGKIARMLASKISLACRKDIFTKDFDQNIYDEFIEKAEQIEKENPFPTKTTKKRKEEHSKSKNKHPKSKKRRKNKRRK